MTPLLPELRPELDPLALGGVVLVFGILLGFASWTDTRRGRYVPDTSSMGLLFAAIAATPLLWENLSVHLLWAGALGTAVVIAWFVGAWADGDMKIFLAYAVLLGPLALPTIVLACFFILLYSVPTMIKTIRSKEKLPRGHRLGTAPGVPGIALALPAAVWLWAGSGEIALYLLAIGFVSYILSEVGSRALAGSLREEESLQDKEEFPRQPYPQKEPDQSNRQPGENPSP